MRKVNIGDVARRAGVSRKTVSRVVNGEAYVSDEVRKRVEKVVAQLNYKPDRQARSLRSGRSFHLAFVYASPSSYFVIRLVEGIRRTCQDAGYELVLHETEARGSRLVLSVLEFAERERLAGLLMMPPMTDDEQLLAALDEEGIVYGRISPGQPRAGGLDVYTTDVDGGRKMMQHLLTLGHRHVAFISGHPAHLAMSGRLEGARHAVDEWSGDAASLTVVSGRNTFESGQSAAAELLASNERPTAIFAANDDMAAGVIFAAQEAGLRIPDDLSVAGFDDTLLAARIWPGLSTVHQPLREMGARATANLISFLKEKPLDMALPIPSELVIRRSTASPPR